MCVCMVLIVSNCKADLHIMLSQNYNDILPFSHFNDIFYRCITEVGASVPFIIAFLLLFYHLGSGVYFVVAQLLTSLIVNLLKDFFAEPRPLAYFSDLFPEVTLRTIEGVTLHTANSFPSGHTAAAFVGMFALTFIFRHKSQIWAYIFFLIAVLAGFSRVYLSQHFLEDVAFGSIIGVTMGGLCAWLYTKRRFKWYDVSIVKIAITKLVYKS